MFEKSIGSKLFKFKLTQAVFLVLDVREKSSRDTVSAGTGSLRYLMRSGNRMV